MSLVGQAMWRLSQLCRPAAMAASFRPLRPFLNLNPLVAAPLPIRQFSATPPALIHASPPLLRQRPRDKPRKTFVQPRFRRRSINQSCARRVVVIQGVFWRRAAGMRKNLRFKRGVRKHLRRHFWFRLADADVQRFRRMVPESTPKVQGHLRLTPEEELRKLVTGKSQWDFVR
eukprot:EG_transcript_28934